MEQQINHVAVHTSGQMNSGAKMRFNFSQFIFGAVLVYFAFHTLTGDQGLASWKDLQKEQRAKSQQVSILEQERREILLKIERLKPETLDLDYVEEIARSKLAYAKSDEVVVFFEPM